MGWIGRHRMAAAVASGCIEAAYVSDADPAAAELVAGEVAGCAPVDDFESLLDQDVDGVVIATPSALHAAQAEAALERGIAVFCQKPLGRTERETRRVIDAARRADTLLAVDLSYRFTDAARSVRDAVQRGELGAPYAADLVFHNAYGPDKPWYRDPTLSGGGCVMDLGVHLVDLALWTMPEARVRSVTSRLFAGGQPLEHATATVEDYAEARIDLESGATVRIACSWHLAAGADAVIGAAFYGAEGGAAMRNVGGSFYDFVADRFSGTTSVRLADPPDDWGGRAIAGWAQALADGQRYDAEVERVGDVAAVLDAIYGR